MLAGAPPKDIPVGAIGVDYRIVGKLGVPIGTIVQVRCRVFVPSAEEQKYKNWDSDEEVEVVAVNGQNLPHPVRIQWGLFRTGSQAKPAAGEVLTVFGYETLVCSGAPAGMFDYVEPIQSKGFSIGSVLIVLAKEKLAERARPLSQ